MVAMSGPKINSVFNEGNKKSERQFAAGATWHYHPGTAGRKFIGARRLRRFIANEACGNGI